MNKFALLLLTIALLLGSVTYADQAAAGEISTAKPEPVRELLIPFEDLNVVLEGAPKRVMLSRQQYEQLLEAAKAQPADDAPRQALVLQADYQATGEAGRVIITGKLIVEVLSDHWHALPLDLSGVGVRNVTLDGKAAALGRADDGRLVLFIQGVGRHKVTIELVAPMQSDTARQTLNLTLPMPAAGSLTMTVPGDVEVLRGAAVLDRQFNEARETTTLQLLPTRGRLDLTMTLNSRLKHADRMVLARSVQAAEVTQAMETIHAMITLEVLHRAVDRFAFRVPDGFEVTHVQSERALQWTVEQQSDQAMLEVTLREPVTGSLTLLVQAQRAKPTLASWSLSRIKPLEVISDVAVVGLLTEERLEVTTLTQSGLMPINVSVLTQAIPMSWLESNGNQASFQPIAAFYAPQPDYELDATIRQTKASLAVASHLLLTIDDHRLQADGGFALSPSAQSLYQFEWTAPAGWWVQRITDEHNKPLRFDRFEEPDGSTRLRAYLNKPIASGQMQTISFHAAREPKGWLDQWQQRDVPLPVFQVRNTESDRGAVAVIAGQDFQVRPGTMTRLMPLDNRHKEEAGLGETSADLTWHYNAMPYQGTLIVQRRTPRLHARTFAFINIQPNQQQLRYELIYQIEQARTDQLSLLLPTDTPKALSITGLDGVNVKEYASEPVNDQWRRWIATLDKPRRGPVRLAVSFQQRQDITKTKSYTLPLVKADGVKYQSGLIAVEGSSELDIKLPDTLRRVDVGELVDADYQPGRRLLGVFGFTGDPPTINIEATRQTTYGLPPALVQQAWLTTAISGNGNTVTRAQFQMKTRGLFLQIDLPPNAKLWTALLNGQATKPQRDGQTLLLDLPAKAINKTQSLVLIYQTPGEAVGLRGNVAMTAPKLRFHTDAVKGDAQAVPMADLLWQVYLPAGYALMSWDGNVTASQTPRPTLAATRLFEVFTKLPLCICMPAMGTARRTARQMESNTQARGLHQAMVTWAQNHDNQYPPNLGVLLKGNFFSADYVISPYSLTELPTDFNNWSIDRQAQWVNQYSDYLIVNPGGKIAYDQNRLAIIGRPSPGATQVTVCWDDGSTASESIEEVIALLQAESIDQQRKNFLISAMLDQQHVYDDSEMVGVAQEAALIHGERDMRPAAVQTDEAQALGVPRNPLPQQPDLIGVRSLPITLQASGQTYQFTSLASSPMLALNIAQERQPLYRAWGLAGLVLLVGLWLMRRSVRVRAGYVLFWMIGSTFVAIVVPRWEIVIICNAVFYAATILVPIELIRALLKARRRVLQGRANQRLSVKGAATAMLGLALLLTSHAQADNDDDGPPVHVPNNAILIPYDPATLGKIPDKLLVPYDQFVELWERAYPDQHLTAVPPPAPYALAGLKYQATLDDGESLLLTGSMSIQVFTDQPVQVPLPIQGGVLVRAQVNGQPARLGVIETPQPRQQKANLQRHLALPTTMVVMHLQGKGRHELQLAIRMGLQRQGGWRIASGRIPVAPATALSLTLPDAQTDVQLVGVTDRTRYETKQVNQTINTAITSNGKLDIRWRPLVSQATVDTALRAETITVVDLQEDGIRLLSSFEMKFPRSQRDRFEIEIPDGYFVEKVIGDNVRGWETQKQPPGNPPGQHAGDQLEIILLKTVSDRENFVVHLRNPEAIDTQNQTVMRVPSMAVSTAVLQSGIVVLRRSPMLEVRSLQTKGLTRTDMPNDNALSMALASADSPLGIRAFEAYRYATLPFDWQVRVEPVKRSTSATWQTILRLTRQQRQLESRLLLDVGKAPLYRLRLQVPDDFEVDQLNPGSPARWTLSKQDGMKILSIQYLSGQQGKWQVLLNGQLGRGQTQDNVSLPRLKVIDIAEQKGDIAVQVDPAFNVNTQSLQTIQSVQLGRVYSWLRRDQRPLTRLVLQFAKPDYQGQLQLTPRRPEVTCTTLTNIRATKQALEYTLLLDFTIRRAGIREVAFLLPEALAEARISVPLLREKTITPSTDQPGWVEVKLLLQDEVTQQLRVLIEDDRLLTDQTYTTPIPQVLTGQTTMRYVAIENTGRDEAVVETVSGLEPINRQSSQIRWIAQVAGDALTHVYVVNPQSPNPTLTFKTRHREIVQTVGAQIGLAQSTITVDEQGTYRAQVVFRVDNTTEQFLEVALPKGASLWTVSVAGQPVRPGRSTDPAMTRHVRIPLLKTAAGDLDYAVTLSYAGQMPKPNLVSSVDFPLVKTVNIDVELSQVSLWLPSQWKWFDFGGTMRRVQGAGQLKVDEAMYLTRKGEQLLKVLSEANDYASIRASGSIKKLASEMDRLQVQAQREGDARQNQALQQQLATQQRVLERAERVIEEKQKPDDKINLYNRYRLNDAFVNQTNELSANVVIELDRNFDSNIQSGEAAKSNLEFNASWAHQRPGATNATEQPTFDLPKVISTVTPNEPQAAPVVSIAGGDFMAKTDTRFRGKAGEASAKAESARRLGEIIQGQQIAQKPLNLQDKRQADRQLARYRERLDQDGDDRFMMETNDSPVVARRIDGADSFAQAEQGWVSLEMTLPHQGVEYNFTTPLGDAQITARAVSHHTINVLTRSAVLLVVVALVLVIFWKNSSGKSTGNGQVS